MLTKPFYCCLHMSFSWMIWQENYHLRIAIVTPLKPCICKWKLYLRKFQIILLSQNKEVHLISLSWSMKGQLIYVIKGWMVLGFMLMAGIINEVAQNQLIVTGKSIVMKEKLNWLNNLSLVYMWLLYNFATGPKFSSESDSGIHLLVNSILG